ncbi:MAG: pyridoxal phosphate-dependent aminotransferase [Armatimonadetes bacterium]|nr:pyridoxal phosphate-dependent aminotransferase [Armatimonadota bacterium]
MNPSVSARASGLRPFLVMEVLERAQELERQGRSIIHLEVGEPDFATPEPICRAAHEALDAGHTHYTHSMGTAPLREAIAARYANLHGVEITPDRVLVTAGSSLAMLYAFGALIEAGDEVIAATPHYPCYPNFVRFFGGTFVEVPTDLQDGYRLDSDAVRAAITPRTKLLLLNSPSNPTGAVLDIERMRRLAEIGVPILSDEIYHGLVYGPDAPTILAAAPDAVVVDGLSKRYAMTGWRLGYLIAPHGLMRTLQIMQQNFMISANAFVQDAAIAALAKADADTARMRAEYLQRRDVMVDLLCGLGFGVPVKPEGAFYVFADASRFTDNSLAFAFGVLECAGVAVAPGVDFGEAGRRSIRLCYAASEDAIREAARRIAEYLACRIAAA